MSVKKTLNEASTIVDNPSINTVDLKDLKKSIKQKEGSLTKIVTK